MDEKFSWKDIEDLAIALVEQYPDHDPLVVRFTELRDLAEALECFEAEPGQSVNEQILEALQAAWIEEKQDQADDDDDDDGYSPVNPFRPDAN